MKKLLILFICLLSATTIIAQNSIDWAKDLDNVLAGSLSVYNQKLDSLGFNKIKIEELADENKLKQVLGDQYKKEEYYYEIWDEKMYLITMPGVRIFIPQDKRGSIDFEFTNPDYHICLPNGKEFFVRMHANQFEKVFPKSYSNIKESNLDGSLYTRVPFSSISNGKKEIWDKWLVFYFEKKSGKLTKIQTYTPG